MKSYTITVNGNVYDVTVEENVGGAVATAPARKAPARLWPTAGSNPRYARSALHRARSSPVCQSRQISHSALCCRSHGSTCRR